MESNALGFLEVWRTLLTFAALIACGLNLSLAFGVFHNKWAIPFPSAWYAYTLATAATVGVSLYWRLSDWGSHFPLNVGDFTAMVPIGGALIAGFIGSKTLGKRVVQVEMFEHDKARGCDE